MFFVNLGLGQFLAVFGAISAISVVLYLLDRSRRRVVVSTLKFWVAAEQPTAVVRRKHISQPFSLLLQLLSMLFFLLAIAQLRIGSQANQSRQHVVILETSAWMNARSSGRRTLMDSCARSCQSLCKCASIKRSGNAGTRRFARHTRHRFREQSCQGACRHHRYGSRFHFAERPSSAEFRPPDASQHGPAIMSEVVFVGSGRVSEADAEEASEMKNLRVLAVADPVENTGLRKIGIKRSNTNPEAWDIYVSAKNYGTRSKQVTLTLTLGGLLLLTGRSVLTCPPVPKRKQRSRIARAPPVSFKRASLSRRCFPRR